MPESIDLKQLSSPASQSSPKSQQNLHPPKRIVAKYIIPASILLGFLAMIGWATREQFQQSKAVSVIPVVVTRAEVQTAGTPLFQAAGWVEPRPSRHLATALTSGIVQEVFVVEGQSVEVGEKLAQLVDTDAKIELEQAYANLALRQAELETALAQLKSAEQRLKFPMKLQAEVSEAKSALAQSELQFAMLPYQIQTLEARLNFAEQNFRNRKEAGEAVAKSLIQKAESDYLAQKTELENFKNQIPILKRKIESLRVKANALQTERDQLIDEKLKVSVSKAEVIAAESRVQQARLSVRNAELRLSRTVITSPIEGRVLEVLANPGSTVMGQTPQSNPEASSIVSLYHPEKLQIRADVRLEDVPLVEPGQPVLIETAISSNPIEGEVLIGTSRANIQKNTLEVKAAIHNPPENLRPEMLVRATFLSPERELETDTTNTEQERMLIPKRLVVKSESKKTAWIVTAGGTAHQQEIRLGNAGTESLVEVIQGLTPTDRLISLGRDSVHEGERVTIANEEE